MEFVIEKGELVSVNGEAPEKAGFVVMTDTAFAEVKISKQDASDHKELKGATLTLTGLTNQVDKNGDAIPVTFPEGSVEAAADAEVLSGSGTALQWKSGSAPTNVKNLPDGNYVLKEDYAPEGYNIATEIRFVIEGGKLTKVDGAAPETAGTVTMFDDHIVRTQISKADQFGAEVKGATLELTGTDKTGKPIDFKAGCMELGTGAESISASGEKLAWISGTGATNIKDLPDGTYKLYEEAAPNGYLKATEMTFEIAGGKITKINGEAVTGTSTVTMIDHKLAETKISKQDQFGDEVKGATLTLTGKDKNNETIVFPEGSVKPGEGATVQSAKGEKLEWISGTTPAATWDPWWRRCLPCSRTERCFSSILRDRGRT